MQIVFICGSLEPARDGVGDYTRRLAVELIRQGHQATVIALNDQHIVEVASVVQCQDDIKLNVLRLPSILKSKARFGLAKRWIDDTNPDLLSLQFVSFAFHPKGLSLRLHRNLKNIASGRKWHIMFHELWLGMEKDSNIKEIIWGKFQRLLIRLIIKATKPACVHTQAVYYKALLINLGIKAKYLPLFSNIPVFSHKDYGKESDNLNLNSAAKGISIVLFGGIHPGAPVEQFVEEVAIYAKSEKITPVLKIIGRPSIEQERWTGLWKSVALPVELLGEQPEQNVSLILSTSCLGISTNPFELSDKSGAVAAMRAHGLPVLCVRDEWKVAGKSDIPAPTGVINYTKGTFKDLLKTFKKNTCGSDVSEIVETFLKDNVTEDKKELQ